MIAELNIRNFGIIDRVRVEFGEGFNVITGETGSGKSLLIKSIPFLFGLQKGESTGGETVIEAVFREVAGEVKSLLEEHGVSFEDEVIVRRVVSSGRSRFYINDQLVTLNLMKNLFPYLVEVQAQRESLSLFNRRKLLNLYDEFCGLIEKRRDYERLYFDYIRRKEELESLLEEKDKIYEEISRLRDFVREIEESGILEVDEEELKRERELLVNAERIKSALKRVLVVLSDSEVSIFSLVREAIGGLRSIQGVFEKAGGYLDILDRVLEYLKELELSISSDFDRIIYDEDRLNRIEEILWNSDRIRRKYSLVCDELKREYESVKRRLIELEQKVTGFEDLKRELEEIRKYLLELANSLSEERKRRKAEFEDSIIGYLETMGFKEPKVEVLFETLDEPSIGGLDAISLLFSANPGSNLYPVERVASGGELSRLMLALYLVVKRRGGATLILDEIDTGIGGYTARVIGELLSNLSQSNQIIVVTHFPQIAQYGHNHFVVEKTLKDGKVYVIVNKLEGLEREMELKRMVGEIKNTVMEGGDGGYR